MKLIIVLIISLLVIVETLLITRRKVVLANIRKSSMKPDVLRFLGSSRFQKIKLTQLILLHIIIISALSVLVYWLISAG
jgi:hypothetical protein